MSTEMEKLLNQLDYYQYHLRWLKSSWANELELRNVLDYVLREKAIKKTEAIIANLEETIAIERIVQLCLTGE